MIEEYFKNWKNVWSETILNNNYQEVSPEEFFLQGETEQENTFIIFKRIECKDGFKFSAQASYSHYCEPRVTIFNAHNFFYETMEVGFPTDKEPLIMEWCEDSECPTETVYGQVPVSVLNEVVKKHGGIINNIK